MIPVARINAILKANQLTPTSLGRVLKLSPSKMNKVSKGEQTLTPDAIGILLKEFEIYPNWLFGFEGSDDEVLYVKGLVPKSMIDDRDRQIQELKNELGEVYKQLAEERRK